MNIKIEKKVAPSVTEVENWPRPKDGDTQWKVGRSAMELARFVLQGKAFPELIDKVVTECGLSSNVSYVCEPEALTYFEDKYNRSSGPRNHDLLMKSKSHVIGIEAKVSESFDDTIKKKKKSQKGKINGITRAEALANLLCGENDVDNIGYQLLTATYGTMKAAADNNVNECIALFIVFGGDVCKEKNYEENCEKNEKDFEIFEKSLLGYNNGYIVQEISGKQIKCWIKKVHVNVEYRIV